MTRVFKADGDLPAQERLDRLRLRHGRPLKVVSVSYGSSQGLWVGYRNNFTHNLTEFPLGVVAVIDEKEASKLV